MQEAEHTEPVSSTHNDDVRVLLNEVMEVVQRIDCSAVCVCTAMYPYDDGPLLFRRLGRLPHIQIQAVLVLIVVGGHFDLRLAGTLRIVLLLHDVFCLISCDTLRYVFLDVIVEDGVAYGVCSYHATVVVGMLLEIVLQQEAQDGRTLAVTRNEEWASVVVMLKVVVECGGDVVAGCADNGLIDISVLSKYVSCMLHTELAVERNKQVLNKFCSSTFQEICLRCCKPSCVLYFRKSRVAFPAAY